MRYVKKQLRSAVSDLSPVSLSVAILALSAAPTPSTSSHMSMMVVSVTPKSEFVEGGFSVCVCARIQ
jgi:hypothetical protein